MCGIAGIIHNSSKNYESHIGLMNKSQHHRGPDDSGIVNLGGATLGHTRLSIVDIFSGHQPMFDNDKDAAITFNGEIYGYKPLRDKLDYEFVTHSDTEVILALYKVFGFDMFDKLKGMFAFGIWDQGKKSLLLARDRFGEKPLYYYLLSSTEVVFSSEIKSLIQFPGLNIHLNPVFFQLTKLSTTFFIFSITSGINSRSKVLFQPTSFSTNDFNNSHSSVVVCGYVSPHIPTNLFTTPSASI